MADRGAYGVPSHAQGFQNPSSITPVLEGYSDAN